MRATKIFEIAKRTGYPVAEVKGWKQRGSRDMKGFKGILCHHTVGPQGSNKPSYDMCKDGRSDLEGPLCHYLLGRDATIYVMAAGRANHAGAGVSDIHTNDYAIGIEVENDGTGEKWSDWLMDCYAKLCNEICKEYDIPNKEVWGHKEHAPDRKEDPSFDMKKFRKTVKKNGNGFLEDKGIDKIPNRDKDGKVYDEDGGGKDKDKDKDKKKDSGDNDDNDSGDSGNTDSGTVLKKEEDLTGLEDYKERKEWEEEKKKNAGKVKNKDGSDLSGKEQKALDTLREDVDSGMKPKDYANVGVSLIGYLSLTYSVVLFFAYLFDRSNTFFDLRLAKMMTGGRIDVAYENDDVGVTDGVRRVTVWGMLLRCGVGIAFGLIIISGVYFGWLEAAIYFIKDKM